MVTADIPLASRCVAAGARVLDPRGRVYTEDSVGDALATRNLMSQLREVGAVTGGPAPHGKRDSSLFLQKLDELVRAAAAGRLARRAAGPQVLPPALVQQLSPLLGCSVPADSGRTGGASRDRRP